MDKGKITIYDVADRAGVAISTVSRVLNGSHEVSDETRQRVQEAIDALQFRPDRTAKMLAQKQTGWLAVAVPSSTSQFYNELLKGIKDCLREYEIDMLLCNMGSNSPRERLWRFLNRGAVDALLLASLPMDDKLERELKMLHAPVMLVGTHSDEFDCIYWDDEAGCRLAVDHLISQGHRKIGMITAHSWDSELGLPETTGIRINAYRESLEMAGITFDPNLVQAGVTTKHAGFSEEAGEEAMEKLLEIEPELTAVFCMSDVQAIGAWNKLIEKGKKVPNDVAVVGYDDIKISRYIGLTSIDQRMQEVGYEATQFLLEHRQSPPTEPTAKQLVPEINVRRSSNLARS